MPRITEIFFFTLHILASGGINYYHETRQPQILDRHAIYHICTSSIYLPGLYSVVAKRNTSSEAW